MIPNIYDDYNSKFRDDEVSCTLTLNVGVEAHRNGQKVVEIKKDEE